jgi:hypothetical protein
MTPFYHTLSSLTTPSVRRERTRRRKSALEGQRAYPDVSLVPQGRQPSHFPPSSWASGNLAGCELKIRVTRQGKTRACSAAGRAVACRQREESGSRVQEGWSQPGKDTPEHHPRWSRSLHRVHRSWSRRTLPWQGTRRRRLGRRSAWSCGTEPKPRTELYQPARHGPDRLAPRSTGWVRYDRAVRLLKHRPIWGSCVSSPQSPNKETVKGSMAAP